MKNEYFLDICGAPPWDTTRKVALSRRHKDVLNNLGDWLSRRSKCVKCIRPQNFLLFLELKQLYFTIS